MTSCLRLRSFWSTFFLYIFSTSRAFSQSWDRGFVNDLTLFGPFAIEGFTQKGSLNYRMAQWMMRADVREALHVADAPSNVWPGPGEGWTYNSSYAACNAYATPGSPSMVDFYRNIAPRVKGSVLVYNGDTDPCVSYEGTREAVIQVGFDEVPGGAYRPWFFNAAAASSDVLGNKPLLFGPSLTDINSGPQMGGHVVDYEHGLSFATVHGSGHMVPQFRPRAALTMLEAVIKGTPLAPLIATDEDILSMSDEAFDGFLDQWTDLAKSQAHSNVAKE